MISDKVYWKVALNATKGVHVVKLLTEAENWERPPTGRPVVEVPVDRNMGERKKNKKEFDVIFLEDYTNLAHTPLNPIFLT